MSQSVIIDTTRAMEDLDSVAVILLIITMVLVTMMALVAVASVSYTFAYKGEYRRRRANRETTDNAGISYRES